MTPLSDTIGKKVLARNVLRSTILAGAFLAAVLVAHTPWIRELELKSRDWRFRAVGTDVFPSQTVMVAIDDATLNSIGWPVTRDYHALLIKILSETGAKTIVFDIIFTDKGNISAYDDLLAAVTEKSGITVHSFGLMIPETRKPSDRGIEIPARFSLHHAALYTESLPHAENPVLPYDELLKSSRTLGCSTIIPDEDGIIRKVPLLLNYDEDIYGSLALAACSSFLGVKKEGISFEEGCIVMKNAGKLIRKIPVAGDGQMEINFQKEFPPLFSLIDILQAYRDREAGRKTDFNWDIFRNKIVLAGVSASGNNDSGHTPLSSLTPLFKVQTQAIETILQENFLKAVPGGISLAVTGILVLLTGTITLLLRPLRGFFVFSAMIVLMILASFYLFGRNIVVPVTGPVLGILLGYLSMSYTDYLEKEKTINLRKLFESDPGQRRIAIRGQKLGGYRLLELLSESASAILFKGERRRKLYAIKILSPSLGGIPEYVERFRREAMTAASINHPGIVKLYKIGNEKGIYYLVMEYLQGDDLARILETGTYMSMREKLNILIRAGEALEKIHQAGLIHRDIKPSNIMITHDGSVKVMDFGLARPVLPEQKVTRTGQIFGTPEYMSPEQCMGEAIDARSDIYSLGTMAYEMFTGQLPFTGRTAGEILEQKQKDISMKPSRLNPGIPAELENIILRMLMKGPNRRYRDASQLLSDLNNCLKRLETRAEKDTI